MADDEMRDWFPTGQTDPIAAARGAVKPALPKRFYREAGSEPFEHGHRLVLDGRPARTPAGKPLAVPTPALAAALAGEWQAQVETIDPARMPVTRIINVSLDGVEPARDEVVADIVRFARSDLVTYRAGDPARLAASQAEHWDPVLAFVEARFGARFTPVEGIVFVEQPESSVARIADAIAAETSALRLAALHVMTTLTGSVLIALAHVGGALDADAAWTAAHVDELYQESVWGADEEAMERRARRRLEFDAASTVYRLAV